MEDNEMMEGQLSFEESDDWSNVENEVVGLLESDTPVEDEGLQEETEEKSVEEIKEEPVEEVKEETKEEAKVTPIPEFDFEITYNGSKEKLSKDEAIKLAQKGKDYDRVREAYDFVKELAEDEGKSIDDYINVTRDNLKDYKIKQLADEKNISEEVAKELYESRIATKNHLQVKKN